jgi:hypothetical protein
MFRTPEDRNVPIREIPTSTSRFDVQGTVAWATKGPMGNALPYSSSSTVTEMKVGNWAPWKRRMSTYGRTSYQFPAIFLDPKLSNACAQVVIYKGSGRFDIVP